MKRDPLSHAPRRTWRCAQGKRAGIIQSVPNSARPPPTPPSSESFADFAARTLSADQAFSRRQRIGRWRLWESVDMPTRSRRRARQFCPRRNRLSAQIAEGRPWCAPRQRRLQSGILPMGALSSALLGAGHCARTSGVGRTEHGVSEPGRVSTIFLQCHIFDVIACRKPASVIMTFFICAIDRSQMPYCGLTMPLPDKCPECEATVCRGRALARARLTQTLADDDARCTDRKNGLRHQRTSRRANRGYAEAGASFPAK